MAASIRQATESDAPQWIELAMAALGEDYPDKNIYDLSWAIGQLDPQSGAETWVAESNGQFEAAISILPPRPANANPVANLGRFLVRMESIREGEELLRAITEMAAKRGQILIARALASANNQQILFEKTGFSCAGFQPLKHMVRAREGTLFYVRMSGSDKVARIPMSDSLPQINELATLVLSSLKLPNPPPIRDGAVGYPLQTEVKFQDGSLEDFERSQEEARPANPPVEISGVFNLGNGYMRVPGEEMIKSVLAARDGKITGGLAYCFDSTDRCMRFVSSFTSDDLSMGALFRQGLKVAQEQLSAVYVEVDILGTAPRLLKTAEQLGFVPIAYLPGFYSQDEKFADVIKLVKLNTVYSPEGGSLTAAARSVAEVIDHNFQDQKLGIAIINLLRGLPIFDGLGDGELRKIARLFTQKLYKPGEKMFNKGDLGNEAYVVMRGQVNILLDEKAEPIATLGNGQIFGEMAFLDGAARVALAVAAQPCILLVIQRSAFITLTQHEPHLGMVVMRNIAMELSNRLRKANAALNARK